VLQTFRCIDLIKLQRELFRTCNILFEIRWYSCVHGRRRVWNGNLQGECDAMWRRREELDHEVGILLEPFHSTSFVIIHFSSFVVVLGLFWYFKNINCAKRILFVFMAGRGYSPMSVKLAADSRFDIRIKQSFQLSRFRRDVHAWDLWFTQSRIGNNCLRFLPLFTLSVQLVHCIYTQYYRHFIGLS